jgi:hypothetical protein
MFFAQFFTNESVTSDLQLHQTIVWVLIFLLVPGAFMLILLFPGFQSAVILSRLGRVPPSRVDDLLAWIAFFLTTYSMVAVGLVTVLAWDALTFDRRDAMVLGSLPLRNRTILGAKLAALATFLAAGSLAISMFNAVMFALTTSDQLGAIVFVTHLFAMLVATTGASVFVFAAIVTVRGGVMLLGRQALAAACGPPLQFLFVVSVLCLVVLSPAIWQVPFVTATFTNWMPPAWFAGVFEQLRGSPRAFDPAFPFMTHTWRAITGTSIAVVGAIAVSVAEFHRQMRAALSPSASPGFLGAAQVSRTLARLLVGRHTSARAIADFILMTLARNRALQAPMAMNAAVGAAMVVAGLSRSVRSVESLMRPRTAVLWIPLVMGYWMAVGLRASFFKPSELPASWSFRANSSGHVVERWLAVRAAMIGFLAPRVLIICALLVPLIGWTLAARHALVVVALVILLVDMMALTIHHTPFTRAYEPGHARLRTRWFLYAMGLYLFAYWPARLDLFILPRPNAWLTFLACSVAVIAGLETAGRRGAHDATDQTDDESLDADRTLTLDIAHVRSGST